MSSFALVNAWSRLSYDMTKGAIGFDPVRGDDGTWLWAVGEGWGVVSRQGDEVTLEVRYGRLPLETLSFAGTRASIGRTLGAGDSASIRIGG